ncbi:DNA-binding protein Fis [Nitrospina gracilis Nb-211]|nr:helix-turn-helix domain-containing protein [Nitrospina gracilis]MCF8720168.1 DNA-binding protein Fis [Nitrospina gracilis Nb-211]
MDRTSKDIRTFLEKWLHKSVKQYVAKMDGNEKGDLYDLLVLGLEKPLLEIVLEETNGNQTKAANILGINRNTLRKKIQDHGIQCKVKV